MPIALSGQKTFISDGQHADLIIVAAKTDPSEGAHGVSLGVLEMDGAEGFTRGRNLEKLGLQRPIHPNLSSTISRSRQRTSWAAPKAKASIR